MKSRPGMIDFFRFGSAYLSTPKVVFAFWGSIVGGIVSLALAVWLHGTRWEVACAAAGAASLVDACLLRYLYEVKRDVRGIKDWLDAVDVSSVQ